MRKIPILVIVLAILASQMIGCSRRVIDLPKLNIAGKSIQGSTFSVKDYTMVEPNQKSTDSFPIILFFPLKGKNQDNIAGMVGNAVEKICDEKGYDFMTNVKVYAMKFYIPLLFGQVKVTIVGEGWSKTESGVIQDELLKLSYNTIENGETL